MRFVSRSVLLAASLGIFGCHRGESDAQRLQRLVPNASATTKVTGTVTVDDEPGKELWVTLHPVDKSQQLHPRAQVKENGAFEITTYSSGDGAPPGEYTITIEWLTFSRLGGAGWVGPDKLNNQYNDPAKTPFRVTVETTPVELEPFDLTVGGSSAAPASSGAKKLQINRRR